MHADLETDLRAAQSAGFEYLEIWAAKLRRFLQSRSSFELRDRFIEHGLKPLSINSIEHVTFRDAGAFSRIKAECDELSSIARVIDCPYIVVAPGKLPEDGASREQIVDESVRVLSELATIAESYDVGLGFEFLGQPRCSVQTLELADEIVRQLDRRSVGLVIDSFHFYAGNSTIEMIEALDPRRLFIFHINDAENLPRSELQDCHRLLPGLGILPLAEMIAAFRFIGYDGVASVEIFRPEYWVRDPVELAHEARAALAVFRSLNRDHRAG